MSDQNRSRGIEFELAWHEKDFINKKPTYSKFVAKEFPVEIAQYLPLKKDKYKILDVGCGPISVLGGRLNGKNDKLEVIGIDPLGDEYVKLHEKHNVQCPHPIIAGFGEKLLDHFSNDHFDLVFSNNALDHAQDPYIAIKSMVAVCKPGCKIIFNVNKNEALNANYQGFHQWNFMDIEDTLLLWNPSRAHVLEECIGGLPYSFSLSHLGNHLKYPTNITCTIHKIDIKKNVTEKLQKDLDLSFDPIFKTLSFIKGKSFTNTERFFVHIFRRGVPVLRTSFTWDLSVPMKSMVLPENGFDMIRVGQYCTLNTSPVRYNNFWTHTIEV